ncbi:hypothetical protein C7475_10310 [Chitinophaga sp. S165]|nr:hypothetical protein C7475_10310 [Chitinophaga sp. S165]
MQVSAGFLPGGNSLKALPIETCRHKKRQPLQLPFALRMADGFRTLGQSDVLTNRATYKQLIINYLKSNLFQRILKITKCNPKCNLELAQ